MRISECGDEDEDERLVLEEQIADADDQIDTFKSKARLLLHDITDALPSLDVVAAAIDVSVNAWPGRCMEIATKLHQTGLLQSIEEKFGKLYPRYGSYVGWISPSSIFGNRPSAPNHGWLESFNGFVIDPTRWVFFASAPELWVDSIDNYDLGGSATRLRSHGARVANPPALADISSEDRVVDLSVLSPQALKTVAGILRDKTVPTYKKLAKNQLFWLANTSLEHLGEDAPEIYRTLTSSGHGGLIPLDLKTYVQDWQEAFEPKKVPSPQPH
jgi:hypothetical protein